MTRIEENIIEITMIVAPKWETFSHMDYDFMNMKLNIIKWANEFEDKYEGVDWNESDLDYYEEIEKFTNEKLEEEKNGQGK